MYRMPSLWTIVHSLQAKWWSLKPTTIMENNNNGIQAIKLEMDETKTEKFETF